MGDYRIKIEGSGSHGCGRAAKDGESVERCGHAGCVDCAAVEFTQKLRGCSSVSTSQLEHWPVPGAGCTRTENPGPVDNLLTGTRRGEFNVEPGQPFQRVTAPVDEETPTPDSSEGNIGT